MLNFIRRLFKNEEYSEEYPEGLISDYILYEKGIFSDIDNKLISVEAHYEDVHQIITKLTKDKQFYVNIDGFGNYTFIEYVYIADEIDYEDDDNFGYYLTILLDKSLQPILIWDPITGILKYDKSIQSYINRNDMYFNPPYLCPEKKEDILIIGNIDYKGDDAYVLEFEDEERENLLIKRLNPQKYIFIKGKTIMEYLHNIDTKGILYEIKCDHILIDSPLSLSVLKELMDCSIYDGHYNTQCVFFLDDIDLNRVHFNRWRKTFVLEIKNERAFYISINSDNSYAFNLKTRG
ncbi:hypothetical protein ETI06_03060 [Macrococcoides goetzii]|nr:hypothetical protein [Macrococcus goetzii]TDM42122.1 hypothetical protein ETI10_03245 [Macrococcus goetzii]TDM47930.1 hypothetical protein ETI08_01990 [Macrococcus goetzii]TDM50977.1 hypothetical protein ETI06_03060 [Macrococcus goetzii]